jgi:cytochrome c biogenesis protein CcdA
VLHPWSPDTQEFRPSGLVSLYSRALAFVPTQVSVASSCAPPPQLTHLSPVSGAILYASGLLTSLSPCALSLIPLTIAYLSDDGSQPER